MSASAGVGTTSTGLQRPRDTQQTCHLEVSLGLPGAGEGRARGRTLSHESLAGVQQDFTAFDNHALDG